MKLFTVAVAACVALFASGSAYAVPRHLEGRGIMTSTTQRTGYFTWETWAINVPFGFNIDYDLETTLFPSGEHFRAPNGQFGMGPDDFDPYGSFSEFRGAGGSAYVSDAIGSNQWSVGFSPFNTDNFVYAGINLLFKGLGGSSGIIDLLPGSTVGISQNRYSSFSGVITSAKTTPEATVSAAPEPAAWGMMIVGFGVAGAALRQRRRSTPMARLSVAA